MRLLYTAVEHGEGRGIRGKEWIRMYRNEEANAGIIVARAEGRVAGRQDYRDGVKSHPRRGIWLGNGLGITWKTGKKK